MQSIAMCMCDWNLRSICYLKILESCNSQKKIILYIKNKGPAQSPSLNKSIMYTNSCWLTRYHKVQSSAVRARDKLEKEQVAGLLQSVWCAVCSHPGMPCSSLFVHLYLQAVESLFHLLLRHHLIGASNLDIRNRKKVVNWLIQDETRS